MRPRVATGPFAGLPYPRSEHLTLYCLGPGMGESMVIHLPDGLWMVVDGCSHNGRNLPLEMLDAFGATDVDLMVITHPDVDHIRGLDAILESKTVHAIWRYPKGAMVRDFLASCLKREPRDRRLEELFRLHEAIDVCVRDGSTEVFSGGIAAPAPWRGRDGASYTVENFAPTSFDALRMEQQFKALAEFGRGGVEASERLLAFLRGDRTWADHPNAISLGLAIRWGDAHVVLAGDIEKGIADPQSGWKGILRRLSGQGRQPERLYLVRDPTVLKVAHHGSKSAFVEEAWSVHTASGPLPLAIIMPFDAHGLPDDPTLIEIMVQCRSLALTGGAAHHRVQALGWSPVSVSPVTAGISMVAVELSESGEVSELLLGAGAALYGVSPLGSGL